MFGIRIRALRQGITGGGCVYLECHWGKLGFSSGHWQGDKVFFSRLGVHGHCVSVEFLGSSTVLLGSHQCSIPHGSGHLQ